MNVCTISHCKAIATATVNDKHYCDRCKPSEVTTPRYKTAEGCERCTNDIYVPHYNCHCGANKAHCTSDYCY